MAEGRRSARTVALLLAGFAMIGLVGFGDLVSSPYLSFAIFYVVPVATIAWLGGHRLGITAALVSSLMGLVADLVTIDAWDGYAVWNLANRLFLFVGIALVVSRLRVALDGERRLAERERELSELKTDRMRQVAEESRVPLADISAKLVNLGFDAQDMSVEEIRSLLTDLANASVRLSAVVESLAHDVESDAVGVA
jgi:hypothetical protein